jgi:hypothetical protein
LAAFVVTLLAISGCAARATPPAAAYSGPPCDAGEQVDTRSWEEVRLVSFTFRLPPGYRNLNARGIDSYVASWRGREGQEIHADYGEYNAPADERAPGVVVCQKQDGSSAPQIAFFRTAGPKLGAALYWVASGGTGPPEREAAHPTTLRMSVSSPREQDLAELLAIVRSVRRVTEAR